MTVYTNFIGIDIGKFSFVVSIHGNQTTAEYENSSAGISSFMKQNEGILPNSLCVVETTGGYELELLYSMSALGYKAHRADTRKVKSFIRSFGNIAKTDALDSRALAVYGVERGDKLALFCPSSQESIELFQLVQRRNDLKLMLVAEKNRLKAPANNMIKGSVVAVIDTLEAQIDSITDTINRIINASPELKRKKEVLKTIPGIGDIIAFELLVLLPELGSLCRRKIASLVGVAPIARDSGKFSGYRRTGRGRCGIKPVLFLAGMAARNSKTHLREFYEKLIAKGKKKMVALVALMRKLLVMANARLKELMLTSPLKELKRV